MQLIGFDVNKDFAELAEEFVLDPAAIVDKREIKQSGNVLFATLPGLPLCWKCTMKHVGQAVGFASELEGYPERIACVVGELGHAYRECPSKSVAEKIRDTYTRILDTGCVPDFTELLKLVSEGWLTSVASPNTDR